MYSLNFQIKNKHTKNGKLKLSNLIEYMLETSKSDTCLEQSYLEENNMVWIVYSWHFEMLGDIYENNKIKIATWVSKVNRLKFYREFLVEVDGKEVVKCSSEFLLLDFYKRKPIYPDDELLKNIVVEKGILLNDEKVIKKPVETLDTIQVEKSDFDLNGHVNNAVYVRWIEDFYTDNYGKQIKNLKIIYSKEIDEIKKVDIKFSEDKKYFEIASDAVHVKGFTN